MSIQVEQMDKNHAIDSICQTLESGNTVHMHFDKGLILHIDRQLPFLCVFRERELAEPSESKLITGLASYMILPENASAATQKTAAKIVENVAARMKQVFGAFLIIEIWLTEESEESRISENQPSEDFVIYYRKKPDITPVLETLTSSLRKFKWETTPSTVLLMPVKKIAPPALPAVLSQTKAMNLGVVSLGIAVRPRYWNRSTGDIFPVLFRKFRKALSKTLQRAFFEFTRAYTSSKPANYQSLGKRSLLKIVWKVDSQMARMIDGLQFLLHVTPTNYESAWNSFQRAHFQKIPIFKYRPLSMDPYLLKRKLFEIPIEKIEDPTLEQLFLSQQRDMDRKLTMLMDRGTPRFLLGSLMVYGKVDTPLFDSAREILEKIPPRIRDEHSGKYIGAGPFAEKAMEQLGEYKKSIREAGSKVIVTEDVMGLMVSQGNLYIGSKMRIPTTRVNALLAHEVETHILTYLNGGTQPLQQLKVGLSGYDELQEGLAVFAEYLAGGMTGARMRQLAARVVAAKLLVEGANFIEVFHCLNKEYLFERRSAFYITARVFRSGGFTKDAIYLRGLIGLLDYLKKGGEINVLYSGKLSLNYIPIVRELLDRKVLHPNRLTPSYLQGDEAQTKLAAARKGLEPLDLIVLKRRKK